MSSLFVFWRRVSALDCTEERSVRSRGIWVIGQQDGMVEFRVAIVEVVEERLRERM